MKEKNSINIGYLMRKYTKLKVSPSAVHSMIDRFDLFLETNMQLIDNIVKRNKRQTVREEDVEIFFGFKEYDLENFIGSKNLRIIRLKKPSDVEKLHDMMEDIFG